MEELEPNQRKSFGIYESALGTLLFIIFNYAFLTFINLFFSNLLRTSEAFYYVASFIVEFLFGVTAYTVAKSRHIRIQEAAGANKKINGKMVGLSLLVAVICLFGLSQLTSVFVEFLELCGYRSVLSDAHPIDEFWKYLICIVTTCITPAICEELLFRGVILSGFKKHGKRLAIVMSALIFMLMHGNAEQTVHQFIIGLVIGYIFIETGNLWIGVLIHFFNNFISVTEVYILNEVAKTLPDVGEISGEVVETSAMNPWLSLFISLIVALVFAALSIYLIKICFKKLKAEDEKLNSPAQAEDANATILVDGAEQSVSVLVDGTQVDTEIENPNENSDNGISSSEQKPKETPQVSVATIIMFAFSGAYLIFDWITSLLHGLGVF